MTCISCIKVLKISKTFHFFSQPLCFRILSNSVAIMSFTDLGTVKFLEFQQEKGYFRLVIAVNLAYKTKYLSMNVWKKELLQNSVGQRFQPEDTVRVTYNQDKYIKLINLEDVSIEFCPTCYYGREQIETLTVDCQGCSGLQPDLQRERINENMVLKSCTPKPYRYSTGYYLELQESASGDTTTYVAVIFPNNPQLYSRADKFQVGATYAVTAWRNVKLLDVIEMDQI